MPLSFGIYKRKLLFFLAFFVVAGGIVYFVRQQATFASINELATPVTGDDYTINVDIGQKGEVTVNDKKISRLLHIGDEYDEFRYIAVEEEGIFIDKLTINITLPQSVNAETVPQSVYAIHGVGSYQSYTKDPHTIAYVANNLSPSATFTIVAKIPKGLIDFPLSQRIWYRLTNLPALAWLIISLALPLIALIVLLMMFFQTHRDWYLLEPKQTLPKPPTNLRPAMAGVLLEGKVNARMLAATLLDLAHRGYIQIVGRGKEFSFGKRRPLDLAGGKANDLRPFEKLLLSKIFLAEKIKSTEKDIQVRIGSHVFSRKIAEVYLEIYQEVTDLGYFVENPWKMHIKYKNIGIGLFFLGFLGFIFGIWLAPEPKFLLLVWGAMLVTSMIIIKMSPQLPVRTSRGRESAKLWYQFKKYLSDSQPIGYSAEIQETFEKYLPYAIALGCETEWAKRFSDFPFRAPDWYSSSQSVVVLEDFINSLLPVVGYIANSLAQARDPIAE